MDREVPRVLGEPLQRAVQSALTSQGTSGQKNILKVITSSDKGSFLDVMWLTPLYPLGLTGALQCSEVAFVPCTTITYYSLSDD